MAKSKTMRKYFALGLASIFVFSALIGLIVPLMTLFQ